MACVIAFWARGRLPRRPLAEAFLVACPICRCVLVAGEQCRWVSSPLVHYLRLAESFPDEVLLSVPNGQNQIPVGQVQRVPGTAFLWRPFGVGAPLAAVASAA